MATSEAVFFDQPIDQMIDWFNLLVVSFIFLVYSSHAITGQPTIINFSLLSKTCEEKGNWHIIFGLNMQKT